MKDFAKTRLVNFKNLFTIVKRKAKNLDLRNYAIVIMGKIRCNLDKSERDLDMQSWMEKNKPLQPVNLHSDTAHSKSLRQDLDELAHDLTLDAL